MGDVTHNEVKEQLEDVLGLGETKTEEEISPEKKDEESKTESQSKDEDKKEQKKESVSKNITLTPDQVEIHSEITKLDVEIDKLSQGSDVDMDKFYDSLEDILTEDEQKLEIDDRPAYLKLVSKKEKEYIKENSNDSKLAELKDKKAELEDMNLKQEGILEVTREFPDYDHEKMIDFFNNELNKKEQNEMIDSATNFGDVFKNTYKKYIERNPKEIKKDEPNPIPNVSNARKQSVSTSEIDDGLKSEDEQMRDALGL